MTNIILLDGGMGQELIRRSKYKAHPLWSAKVMMDEPEIVEAVHGDYIEAGAKVITLNAYSATPERLAREGAADLFKPLQQRAIEAAHRARDNTSTQNDDVKIAGCLPPLFTSYRPELAPDYDACLQRYREIASLQADHVDLFLCETMGSIKEGKAASMAALETGRPTWLSFTLEDEGASRLRSSENLADALNDIASLDLQAVLLNCSAPEAISHSISALKICDKPFGAYANGFTSVNQLQQGGTVDVLKARQDLGPQEYAAFAMEWIENGASIIGGCCEVGPAHIAHLNNMLRERGYETTADIERRH